MKYGKLITHNGVVHYEYVWMRNFISMLNKYMLYDSNFHECITKPGLPTFKYLYLKYNTDDMVLLTTIGCCEVLNNIEELEAHGYIHRIIYTTSFGENIYAISKIGRDDEVFLYSDAGYDSHACADMYRIKKCKLGIQVLGFIWQFRERFGKVKECLTYTFTRGYCLQFAQMLKATFNRGKVCILAPHGHFVWVDEDGSRYDINGESYDEYECLIPLDFIPDKMLKDFRHIPEESYGSTKLDIKKLIIDYKSTFETDDDDRKNISSQECNKHAEEKYSGFCNRDDLD